MSTVATPFVMGASNLRTQLCMCHAYEHELLWHCDVYFKLVSHFFLIYVSSQRLIYVLCCILNFATIEVDLNELRSNGLIFPSMIFICCIFLAIVQQILHAQ